MIGVEVLICFVIFDGQLCLFGEFIGVVEEIGFIIDIGKWIVDEVCKQVRVWYDKGYDFFVVINIFVR